MKAVRWSIVISQTTAFDRRACGPEGESGRAFAASCGTQALIFHSLFYDQAPTSCSGASVSWSEI